MEWNGGMECSNQSKNKTSRKLLCLPQVLFSGIPSRLVALLFAPFLYILSSCHILLDVAKNFILCITRLVGSTVVSWLTHPSPDYPVSDGGSSPGQGHWEFNWQLQLALETSGF